MTVVPTTAARVADGWTPEALARGAVATIDLDALRHNLALCRERAGVPVMAVVKADAYGHGLVPCALAARAAGAEWLGVALLQEAVALRDAGVEGRILAWLGVPGSPWAECVALDVDLGISALWSLDVVREAARATGRRARVHLKADTGLSRNGATSDDWPALVAAAVAAEAEGTVVVAGVWSHLASADEPEHPSVAAQLAAYDAALAVAEGAGLRPEVRHLANSAGAHAVPGARHDLVRVGIHMYGLSSGVASAAELGLRPVMSLRARLASVKRVPAGSGVSYGQEYTTDRATTLGLVPVGYADGLPRAAKNAGPVLAAGAVRTVAGRVCMDQVVVDLGDDDAQVGDEVVIFGADGPSADDWAVVCGTIGYEIVTRIGPRVPRVVLGGDR
ncbi:MAG TPA: alanine racemase [Candidatus Nanopelagicales bacterium]|nr:alanine racemase [Candidatus Nanopelagicales bacterium]